MATFVRDPVTGRPFRWVGRDEWGAAPPTVRYRVHDGATSGVFHHYSVTPRPTNLFQGMQWMRDIQAIHMAPPRGWFDFAYNLAVGDNDGGTIYEGRGLGIANGAQRFGASSHAVVRLGGHPNPGESITANEIDAHICALRLIHRAGYRADRVRPHRAVGATSCPGDPMVFLISDGVFNVPLEPETPVPPPISDQLGEPMEAYCNHDRNNVLAKFPAGWVWINVHNPNWTAHNVAVQILPTAHQFPDDSPDRPEESDYTFLTHVYSVQDQRWGLQSTVPNLPDAVEARLWEGILRPQDLRLT